MIIEINIYMKSNWIKSNKKYHARMHMLEKSIIILWENQVKII
jgi:hypothetical protein